MATRKKKTGVIESAEIAESMEMPGTIGGAKIVFTEPRVDKGSHLTVTTYPDGRTELVWDDEALLRDVRMALLKAESNIPASVEFNDLKPAVKAKVVTRKKKNEKSKQEP